MAKQGHKTDYDIKAVLYEKLLFGYSNYFDVLSSMRISVVSRVIHLPISTRAIGFITRFLVRKFACLGIIENIDPHALCCAMYRIHLIMYEIKLINSKKRAEYRNSPVGEFEEFYIDGEIRSIIYQLGAGFAPLINLLSSIGILQGFNTVFVPRHPVASTHAGIPQIDPSLITYSNLRNTVESLSNVATNRDVRMWFYERNPIPGARWSQRNDRRRQADGAPAPNPDFPLLLNADEIMPPIYQAAQIRADVNLIQTSIELVGRKYQKYSSNENLEYKSPGNNSMLVCNEQTGIRCADLSWRQENEVWVTNYSAVPALTSTSTLYWTIDKLSEADVYAGILHLLGELPKIPTASHSIREIQASKNDVTYTFADALSNLLG